jgi:hypothetical protein
VVVDVLVVLVVLALVDVAGRIVLEVPVGWWNGGDPDRADVPPHAANTAPTPNTAPNTTTTRTPPLLCTGLNGPAEPAVPADPADPARPGFTDAGTAPSSP